MCLPLKCLCLPGQIISYNLLQMPPRNGFEIQSLNDSLFTIHPKIVFSLIFGFKYVVKLISSEIFLSLLGRNVADSGFQ